MGAAAILVQPVAALALTVDLPDVPPLAVLPVSVHAIEVVPIAGPVELELHIAARGAPGRDGDASGTIISRTAGMAIGGHRAVSVDDSGHAVYADPASPALRVPAGISTGAASMGAAATIQLSGSIDEPSWSWAAGAIYLAAFGLLTQTAPVSGAVVIVGFATGPTSIRIDPRLVALLS